MASTVEGNNPRPSCWCHCAAGVRVQGEGGRGGQGGGDRAGGEGKDEGQGGQDPQTRLQRLHQQVCAAS